MRRAALLGLVLIAGCADAPPARTPLEAKTAEVCVIRDSHEAQRVSMMLQDNGRLVGATRGSTYVCWLAAPGEHQLVSADDDTGPLLFQAAPGGHYFLHQEISEMAGLHAHLDWVTERAGHRLIDRCDGRVVAHVNGQDDAMAVAPAVSRR